MSNINSDSKSTDVSSQYPVVPNSVEQRPTLEYIPMSAKFMAHFISMGPFAFQAVRCLKKYGILKFLYQFNKNGATLEDIRSALLLESKTSYAEANPISKESIKLNAYGIDILLDAGLSTRILSSVNKKYFLTTLGYYIEFDEIVDVNMNFTHDVCYQGLFDLDKAIETNSPAGLKVFGNWKTIYEGLTNLPEKSLKSWMDFDHFYSDGAFPRALPYVFKTSPKKIMDVGGNTGKFAIACALQDPSVSITIVDHPNQIEICRANTIKAGIENQINLNPCDLLSDSSELPIGFDIIWMSQFLDCFSEVQIVYLLKKVSKSLNKGGSLLIMETFTDNQKFESAKFCLDMTSLYFTAMANGNSRMYPLERFKSLIEAAELKIESIDEGIKLFHTLIRCGVK